MRYLLCLWVMVVVTVGCGSSQSSERSGSLLVMVTAGPTCPVARVDQPACTPRPVKRAQLRLEAPASLTLVTDNAGIARGDGIIVGSYRLAAQPVDGVMGTPPPMRAVIRQDETTTVSVSYDTGIR